MARRNRRNAAAVDPDRDPPLSLDRVLDLNAAFPLKASLLARRGSSIEVDASEVDHLGASCAQVLLAAAATWAADGLPFTIAAASEAFERGTRLLGLQGVLISKGTTA